MKKVILRFIIVGAVIGAGYGGWRLWQSLPARQEAVPTTRVRRGDVIVRSYARGELRAVRSATLTAPNLFGTVQVTKLAPLGAFAREKNLIVEFDDSEVASRLEQRQLELEQVDEQIKKAQADLAIRNNQDEVDLLRSRFAVRRAELNVKQNELLAEIDRKKNLLNLDEAKRSLQQLESDIKNRRDQAQAELAVLRAKRDRTLLDIRREQMRLQQVKLLAPISGLVAIRQNRSGFSGQFGTVVPDIREGDQVPPGSPVADVLDLSELEIVARVGELDRANLTEGQDVLIRLDALPDNVFNGKIKSMSGTASANIFSSDPGKKFDVVFSIDMRQLLKTLGAKPDQIERILRTAEENRKKPMIQASTSMLSTMGGAFAGGGDLNATAQGGAQAFTQAGAQDGMQQGSAQGAMQGGDQQGGDQQGGDRQGGGRGMRGAGGFGGGGQMSPEQAQKMREALQKALNGRNMQDLSQEERQKIFTQLRAQIGAGDTKGGDAKKGDTKEGDAKKDDTKRGDSGRGESGSGSSGRTEAARTGGAMTFGPQAPGGEGGRRGGGPGMPGGTIGGFTQKDLDSAELPPPPEEESQLDVLLRPGLLADVEIIVEKVPNAIYIPNQSLFEREGKPVVYVKQGDRFEPRFVKIAKRSESVTIVSEGIRQGEAIAMSDPFAKPGEGKKKGQGKSGGGASAAMPVGSKGGQ
jgi:HlyD family secretion protein